MSLRTVALVLGLGSAVAFSAGAEPQYPNEPPPDPPASYPGGPAPGGQPAPYGFPAEAPPAAVSTDPNAVRDPGDDYADESSASNLDVAQDNQAAQSLDDGYDPEAYQQFQSALSPYGNWVDAPNYGRVWVPSTAVVGDDFTPYGTGGHWLNTDYGWTWASDWDWGWAPFHYGRWSFIGGFGWGWIPGRIWGPAWVSWRCGGGYVGWAPLPPRGVVIGPPLGIRSPWRFTTAGQLGARRPVWLPSRVVPSVFARTTVVNTIRPVGIAGGTVHLNAGPHGAVLAANGVRVPPPVSIRTAAPTVLPRANVAPRLGAPLNSRPWVQAHGVNGTLQTAPRALPPRTGYGSGRSPAPTVNAPAPTYRAPQPGYNRPTYAAPSSSRPAYVAPTYNRPTYNRPTYAAPSSSRPAYVAPTYNRPTYVAPTYNRPAPAPTYNRPTYSAPVYSAPHYAAPAAPVYSAPHYAAPAAPVYSAPHYSAPAASHFGGGFGRHR